MLHCLPPELQDWILKCLPTKRDVGNCRLACKAFQAFSTPFLFRRVTICKRFEALTRAQEIINSSSLQEHVKELIWDISAYSEDIAVDFENYIDACQRAPRDFRDQTSVIDDGAYSSFCQTIGLTHHALPWHELTLDNMETYEEDTMYATGMHRGYDDYFRKWHSQRRIERDDTHFHVFQTALRRCPEIHRILITDFSLFTRAGEEYNDLCFRLFGNTREPEGAIPSEDFRSDVQKIKSILESECRQDVEITVPDETDDETDTIDASDADGDEESIGSPEQTL